MLKILILLKQNKKLPHLLAGAGMVFYFFHALHLATTTTSYLDEGLYLYKGLLIVTGKYKLFQAYGLWMNQLPLAFLIPGVIQKWFGPGLESARYFMILLAELSLLGIWILANRWSGAWLAAFSIWAIALNPAEVKIYTLAITEGEVACAIIWALVFTLRIKQSAWKIFLGAMLATLAGLIRVEILVILPFWVLYVFWQHGKTKGFINLFTCLLFFTGGQVVFGAGILTLWSKWLWVLFPKIFSNLKALQASNAISLPPKEKVSAFTITLYFWLSIRLHFVAFFSVVTSLFLYPKRFFHWRSREKAFVFLITLFFVLFVEHLFISNNGGSCVSCILIYAGYFDFIGLIVLAVAARYLIKSVSPQRTYFYVALLFISLLGLIFSAYEEIGKSFIDLSYALLSNLKILSIIPRLPSLKTLLTFRIYFGLILVILILILIVFLIMRIRKSETYSRIIISSILTYSMIAGMVLTPTSLLGNGNNFFNCSGTNVLESYRQAGDWLNATLPAGSKVYWSGRIPAIFLYTPNIKIYPAQLNNIHNFFIGGNSDQLNRFGRWNDALAIQWMQEADYVLIQKGEVQNWESAYLRENHFSLIASSRKVERCRWQSVIDIYQKSNP